MDIISGFGLFAFKKMEKFWLREVGIKVLNYGMWKKEKKSEL